MKKDPMKSDEKEATKKKTDQEACKKKTVTDRRLHGVRRPKTARNRKKTGFNPMKSDTDQEEHDEATLSRKPKGLKNQSAVCRWKKTKKRIATRICQRMHADECMPMNEDRDRDSIEDQEEEPVSAHTTDDDLLSLKRLVVK